VFNYERFSLCGLALFFELNKDNRTRGHSLKLAKHRTDKDLCHYFFSERVVNNWKQMDKDTVEVSSLNSFKNHLANLRRKRIDFFMDLSLAGSSK